MGALQFGQRDSLSFAMGARGYGRRHVFSKRNQRWYARRELAYLLPDTALHAAIVVCTSIALSIVSNTMKHYALLFIVGACAEDVAPLTVETDPSQQPQPVDAGKRDTGVASTADASQPDVTVPPPTPQGCITDVGTGDRVYTCNGLTVSATIPAVCQRPGCGLILQLHGDTGTGPLIDSHTKLHELGKQNGYIVLSPNGNPSVPAWSQADDTKLIALTTLFRDVFRADSKKVHVAGFSRGGFAVWRLICKASDLFASAAPAAAGNGNGEVTCFSGGQVPAQKVDIVFLMGRTDAPVPFGTMTSIRDNARSNYGTGTVQVVAGDSAYTHNRWINPQGLVVETFEHSYETRDDGPWGSARGHCFPGSTSDPFAPQYAVPCQGPNAFTWGAEVMKFFLAHPRR
jgi:dienelactone hydrolase